MEKTGYFLGLDIGSDSVGYAATDKQYSLLKFHGEPVWGVHLFDEAGRAADRRAFRVNRRRIDRRQQRIKLLQELFAVELSRIDPRFFIRQAESALYPADKQEKYAFFNDAGYTDAQYHRDYPTIHHLINDLMESDRPHDARLVYLACAWLIAHRGHFLSPIDPNNVQEITDFHTVYSKFHDFLIDAECQIPWNEDDLSAFETALCRNEGITKKTKALSEALFPGKKVPKDKLEDFPYSCDAIIRALAGGKVEAEKLFSQPAYADLENKSFSLDMDDEKMAAFLSEIGDDSALVIRLKELYDWALLMNILGGSGQTISKAKIAIYRQHQDDLKWLKRTIRKYCPQQFNAVFRKNVPNNYASYSDHGPEETKKADQEAFCKYVRDILKKIAPDAADQAQFEEVKARLETNRFMPKQKSGENRVIPYQLYWVELDQLLKRAEQYLPFLKKQEDGLTVADKIRKIFLFRIPYFVGPLGAQGKNRWAVRKPGRITPWNFESMVDFDQSEEAFIRRLTNTCTYLPGEDVLPRDSLLYHRFTVLNEINSLKINGCPISVALKQGLYNDVFLRHQKVTWKRICDYLKSNGVFHDGDELSGIDKTIKSDLKPQQAFRRLLESGALTEADAEEIILRRTYSEDTSRFRRWLVAHYPSLPNEDIRYLCRLSFKDFGRLSRRFLTELEGTNKETGEVTTIMQALWETNDNLMELLSDKYSFRQAVDEEARQWYLGHPQSIQERLADMYVPSAVRRSVQRALVICKEVTKAMGKPPERIFIEMTRGSLLEQKGKRTVTRRDQLLALYEKCRDEDVRLMKQQLESMGDAANTKLQSEKLFLYYLQLGRCMYTGKPIELQALMDEKRYDIDHIYPQSLVKDESLQNNKVLVDTHVNERKSNGLVPTDVRSSMVGWWEHLKTVGLITDEKFRRLTRTLPFTAEEKWGFINRQLTETSQATKAAATLLKELYPDTEIVYVKAQLASDFRKAFDRLKCREYNDLHHAKDAYLNIVVGNVHKEKFNPLWFNPDMRYSVNPKAIYTQPLVCRGISVWDGTPMLEKVKATVLRSNAHMTRYAYKRQGKLFEQQPNKKSPGLIPRKKGLDPEKYGGYNGATISYFCLTQYIIGKKKDIMFMPVELLCAEKFLNDLPFRAIYAKEKIGKVMKKLVDSVSFPLGDRILPINTVLSLDGYCACITTSSSAGKKIRLSPQIPFVADYKTERYLKYLSSLNEKHKNNPRYIFDPAADKVTMEENEKLYQLYMDKLEKSVFKHRPTHPLETMKDGKDIFSALDIWEQIKVLMNIHTVFCRKNNGVDLVLIGGGPDTAISELSSKLSNLVKPYKDVRIVDCSASGLWETRSQNLRDLI